MIPVLYSASESSFTGYGLGSLVDVISGKVDMQDTQMELTMDYPVDGAHFSDIQPNRIILAKPCQTDDPQPFRIYRVTKPIGGKITVYARHLSYDLSGIPVLPFTATSAADFATKIKANAAVTCPFDFETDITKEDELEVEYPVSARYLLSDNEGSWQDTYGGELVFDKYKIKLLTAAGENRGVVIRYGVDLIDAKMEENLASVYTGILPYYYDAQSKALTVGDVQYVSGTFEYQKILPVDVTEYILESELTKAKVNEVGQTWLNENMIGVPAISLTLSYAQIDQTVRLFDTVTVRIERMGIDVIAKVTSTTYDFVKERYTSVNVGDVRETFIADIYDASRLKTGLLDMKRIKEKSITESKMGGGSVSSRVLQNGAVITDKLEDGSVTYSKCGNSIVGYFDGTNTFQGLRVSSRRFFIDGHPVYLDASGNLITEN